MQFFKRRSRQNSYVDSDREAPRASIDYSSDHRPESSRKESEKLASDDVADMYPRQNQPQETSFAPQGPPAATHSAMPIRNQAVPQTSSSGAAAPMPDLLAQAFNQAIRPYTEKIEQLETQIADMQSWIDQLEQQRAEVHNWIDKRGLRPGTFNHAFSKHTHIPPLSNRI